MSTICLAAQRSFTTGEAVYFAWRLPAPQKVLFLAMMWLLTLCTFIIAGLYAHIYWNCHHPMPEPKPTKMENPDTRLSEMHYVYISKPFPQPAPKPAPAPQALPPLQDEAPVSQDNDWRQAPEGDLSDRALPGAEEQTPSLKARFLQALQEQKEDYQQGKIPEPPDD
ncbi:hypothetical protein ACEWB5_17965 [Citrobacter koseri]|uniref:hypothetical protein n=1 Tax=Citrobacter TaxID=544 RepID=UPI000E1487C6|nr:MULTISPECIES: hypothetical protein [Citrobacter]MBJ8670223.1 hypothetical protein [Citrobacter koseri]MBJ8762930.1 hypothetical protein [Citrobacter koseri]MBJ9230281.1 hypothetical protein [Citrobacter koseri]MDM3003906.1 hypothetical protein [Citrobacter sp. CK188]SUY00648.1 Uncharacterised protein [Citrobacter koseri]